MKVYGVEITPAQINTAVSRMKDGPFVAAWIEDELKLYGVPDHVAYRAADRIIQRERKAGHIMFNGGVWVRKEAAKI